MYIKKTIAFIVYMSMILLIREGLYAQDVMDTVIQIREVSVKAIKPLKRDAMVISEIDSLSLHSNRTASLDKVLANASVLHIRSYSYGGLSTVSFRGTAPGHTRLYWNDMEISDPGSGQVDLSLVPAGFVDEIQLHHGSSALQEGGGALGGSVHLNSVPDWKQGFSAEVIQNSGSFNRHHSYGKVSFGKDKYSGNIRIYRESAENDFSYINTDNGLWNKEKMQGASSLRKGYQADFYLKSGEKHILSLHNWIQHSNRNLPPVMSYMGPGRMENQEDAAIRLTMRWKYYGALMNSKLSGGFSLNELNYYLAEKESSQKIFNTQSKSGNFFIRHEAESNFSQQTRIRSLLNLDYVSANYLDINSNTGFEASRPGAGWTLSVHHRFDVPVTAYLLLREELTGKDFSPLMPAAGLNFSPGRLSNLSFTANVSRNYHYPGLNDLYWVPGGNPGLKPEEGYLGDVSARLHWKTEPFELKTSLTAFYSGILNWILWRPGEYGFWQAENLERVKSSGLEYLVDAHYSMGKSMVRIMGTYAWTRAYDSSFDLIESGNKHNQLIYMPEHKGNINLLLKTEKIKLNYGLFASGMQFTTTDNDAWYSLPAFCLHDAKISGSFSFSGIDAETGIGINNIFNTSYQVIRSRPMPGRNFNIELKISL